MQNKSKQTICGIVSLIIFSCFLLGSEVFIYSFDSSGNIEIDFLTGVYSRLTAEGVVVKKFSFERNQMFIDAIDHFSKSILGEEHTSLELPSLNCVKSSCELTANAWKSRTFIGSIKGEIS